MELHHAFTVRTPIDTTFRALTDLEFIAPCMPGARLDGRDGDDYLGVVRVKVGPITTEFAGSARFLECDPEHHRASIVAKGRDTKAAGTADAVVRARLEKDGEETRVIVDTELNISGRIAQFGRSAMADISAKLIDQFAAQLDVRLQELSRPTESSTVERSVGAGPEVRPVDIAELVGVRQLLSRWAVPIAFAALLIGLIARRRSR